METVREAKLPEPSPSTTYLTLLRVYTHICLRGFINSYFCTFHCVQFVAQSSSALNSASNLPTATARSVGKHFSHKSMPGISLRQWIVRKGSSGPRARALAYGQPQMVRPSSPHRAMCMVAVAVFWTYTLLSVRAKPVARATTS